MSSPAPRPRGKSAVTSFVQAPGYAILLGVLALGLAGVSLARGKGSDAFALGLLGVLGLASGLLERREDQRGSAYGGVLGFVASLGRPDPLKFRRQGLLAVLIVFGAGVGLGFLLVGIGVSDGLAWFVSMLVVLHAWSWLDRLSADR
jgi:hypothetical protein